MCKPDVSCINALHALMHYIGDVSMVTWIVENFSEMGRIKDSNGDLPIHFAAAGGKLVRL